MIKSILNVEKEIMQKVNRGKVSQKGEMNGEL